MEKYTVYTHTFPDGRVYVGYLNMGGDYVGGKTIDEVWDNGEYHKNKKLYNDIQAAEWNNISHEVVYSELTKEQAVEKKKELCILHKSYLPEYGYNRPIDAGIKNVATPKSSVKSNPKCNIKKSSNKMMVTHRIVEFIIQAFFDEDDDVQKIQSRIEYLLSPYSIDQCKSMLKYLAAKQNYLDDLIADKDFEHIRSKVGYIVEVMVRGSKYY